MDSMFAYCKGIQCIGFISFQQKVVNSGQQNKIFVPSYLAEKWARFFVQLIRELYFWRNLEKLCNFWILHELTNIYKNLWFLHKTRNMINLLQQKVCRYFFLRNAIFPRKRVSLKGEVITNFICLYFLALFEKGHILLWNM